MSTISDLNTLKGRHLGGPAWSSLGGKVHEKIQESVSLRFWTLGSQGVLLIFFGMRKELGGRRQAQ